MSTITEEVVVSQKVLAENADDDREFKAEDLVKGIIRTIRFFQRKWKPLVIITLLGALLGFFMAWRSAVTYNAKVNFILEEGKNSGGGLSAVAGQLGFDLGGMGSGSSILSGDNIIGLLKSKRLTEATLLSAYDESKKYSLADKYAEVYNLRQDWENHKNIRQNIFFPPLSDRKQFSRVQDSLLDIIENRIIKDLKVERKDKKMTFFEVQASFKDELLSKYFTERLVNYAVDFYIETKTRQQRANVARLQHRTDSMAALLNRRTYSAAAAQSSSLDVNPAYGTSMVQVEVSSRDKVMVATIYAEMVKNLEIQKATLTQETPVIQLIDGADLPLEKNQKSKLLYAIIGGLLAFIGSAVLLILIRAVKNYS